MNRLLLTLPLLLVTGTAFASEKLSTPYVEKGEWEIEYFASRSVDRDGNKDNAQTHETAIGYGVTDRWKTELSGVFDRAAGERRTTLDVWEWENQFQFTERGQYWVDAGAQLAYEYKPQKGRADTIEAKLLLAKDVGRTSHVLNLVGEKDVGGGDRAGLEGKLLWSSRYTVSPMFEPGFEWSSNFGVLKDHTSFDEQEHGVGPAAYGRIPLKLANNSDALRYRAGYLFGLSDAAPEGDAFLQLEYEIRF